MVLEMAMRGRGQIAELCRIAEPEIGVITNIGPVHLELLGTLEAIAEAKAELLVGTLGGWPGRGAGGRGGSGAHIHDSLVTITFGAGGDVSRCSKARGGTIMATIGTPDGGCEFRFRFAEADNLVNALAAIAIGVGLEALVTEMARRAPGDNLLAPTRRADRAPRWNPARERLLQRQPGLDARGPGRPRLRRRATGRHAAVLGEMAELGPDGAANHREAGAHARQLGVGPILGVGGLAR